MSMGSGMFNRDVGGQYDIYKQDMTNAQLQLIQNQLAAQQNYNAYQQGVGQQMSMNDVFNQARYPSSCAMTSDCSTALSTAYIPPRIVTHQSPNPTTPKPPEKKSMFKEITADIKSFLLEHRGVIYFIAAALILDHFIFRGAFKSRLQSMADRVVTKVEEKIQ